MAGLLGVVATENPDKVASDFSMVCEKMMQRNCKMTSEIEVREGLWRFGEFETTRVSRLDTQQLRNPDTCALFHGVIQNSNALSRVLGESPASTTRQTSSLLQKLYLKYGIRFVDMLRGEFCIAIADSRQGRIWLATDAVGTHPLYWHQSSKGFCFSSDLSALLRALPSPRRLDIQAVADYITLGSLLGERTLAKDVHLLAPGTTLEFDAKRQHVRVSEYLDLAEFFGGKCHDKALYLERVDQAFEQAVGRATDSPGSLGLALSGGLDSRAILSASGAQASTIDTYTLGIEGCADQVIAERLAKIAGTRHEFFRLDERYLRDFLPNMTKMVSLTDGMYVSHGLTEMLALEFLRETNIQVLLRGHGGELAKTGLAWPLHTDQRVYSLTSTEQVADYLSERANYITRGLPFADFMKSEFVKVAGSGSRLSFRELLKNKPLTPPECCAYLYLRELTRRFTIPSIELFRTELDVRLPYLDRDFLKVLLAAPSEWRDGTEIHRRLIASGLPRLSKIRNSNTGAPANASPAVEYVLDKFNSLFKRLNVHGYRHYHNFDAWMRSMLLQSVESELLASGARVHGFIKESALRDVIEKTRSGIDDRGYFLQVLLILELWLRENDVEVGVEDGVR